MGKTSGKYLLKAFGSALAICFFIVLQNGVARAQSLINIDIDDGATKTGLAATGQSTNDFWNGYYAPYSNLVSIANLKYSDGSLSGAGLTVSNAPGSWFNASTDAMLSSYAYNLSQPIWSTITNLIAGSYDVYVYGHGNQDNQNGVYSPSVGSVNYGTNCTVLDSSYLSPTWTEGVQYVVFRGVQITNSSQVLAVTTYPGAAGYSVISGIQIVSASPCAPTLVSQPKNQTVVAGATAIFNVQANGSATLTYQWFDNAVPIANATNAAFTITNAQTTDGGLYSVIVSNSIGYVLSSNATLTVLTVNTNPVNSLINIDYDDGSTSPLEVGFAATGKTTNDYWNVYYQPYSNLVSLPNLKYFDGSVSGVGITISNGPGSWASSAADLMYASYSYNGSGAPITSTFTNLPVGAYDLYVYGHGNANNQNGVYNVISGGVNYGTNSTVNGASYLSSTWAEGVQYVVFRGVQITNQNQPIVLNAYAGASGYSVISGVQLVSSTPALAQKPMIVAQPQSSTNLVGSTATFAVQVTGTAPFAYQWFDNTLPIANATNATLTLTNVQLTDVGSYSVAISNVVNQVVSDSATLIVNPVPVGALINIDFDDGATKTGFAATGQSGNDFWNGYYAPWATLVSIPHLKYSDGTISSTGLIVTNGPGSWYNTSADPMYGSYAYNQGGTITATITNLTTGTYDVYVYGHGNANDQNGVYNLCVGAVNYWTNSTTTGSNYLSSVWTENVQYVVFRSVQITDPSQALVLNVYPGASGYSVISGMQLAAVTPQTPAPLSLSLGQRQFAGKPLVLQESLPTTTTGKLTNLKRLANGAPQMQLNGISGQSYLLQSSSNMVNWNTLSQITMTNAARMFVDPNAADASHMFYRLIPATVP